MPFDFWKFLAGLAIFLFGLHFIEQSLKVLVGRSFKKFLRKQTNNVFKGILGGTIVTLILQSSSVVTLMVLAFVGAGILSLKNAIGIILGTNLGTTFTGWIVAMIGFKLNIEALALPLIALGGLPLVFFSAHGRIYDTGRFLLGFGFLFMGLAWMKESIDLLATNFDLSLFDGLNPYFFFLVGLILTAIIQSSSAAMVITLSGISAGIISLPAAAAMVIGSDLGTTVTVLLGSLGGNPEKKQVAAVQFFFNLTTDLLALALLYPLLWLLTQFFKITDPLITLVSFHSAFNLFGILLWLPFISWFSRFLERRFSKMKQSATFISRVPESVPSAAIEALRQETYRFLKMVLYLNTKALQFETNLFPKKQQFFITKNYQDNYSELKQLEGEIIAYYLKVQKEKMDDSEADQLSQLSHSLRYAMHSAKSMKDILHNIKEFEASSNDYKLELYQARRKQLFELDQELLSIFSLNKKTNLFERLLDLKRLNHRNYQSFLQQTYAQAHAGKLSNMELATFLNANREFYNANNTLILAMKDLWLSPAEAADFFPSE